MGFLAFLASRVLVLSVVLRLPSLTVRPEESDGEADELDSAGGENSPGGGANCCACGRVAGYPARNEEDQAGECCVGEEGGKNLGGLCEFHLILVSVSEEAGRSGGCCATPRPAPSVRGRYCRPISSGGVGVRTSSMIRGDDRFP
ncbi:hypothetical protein KCH_71360 [Kitasatospora cheerisanensis KCTC 2395]|uniref:Uncharacterized protein n=1 Tax=Kitasatospora cheerisanensis KCTC 2395 TaxID=1348663 RepID=A0A066YIQ8_9ACTN|nr:hypothetical protein KCH_71360 [Kitasatospora cheerisanensis KCTC 2395]